MLRVLGLNGMFWDALLLPEDDGHGPAAAAVSYAARICAAVAAMGPDQQTKQQQHQPDDPAAAAAAAAKACIASGLPFSGLGLLKVLLLSEQCRRRFCAALPEAPEGLMVGLLSVLPELIENIIYALDGEVVLNEISPSGLSTVQRFAAIAQASCWAAAATAQPLPASLEISASSELEAEGVSSRDLAAAAAVSALCCLWRSSAPAAAVPHAAASCVVVDTIVR